jgi:hypothetical protein
MAACHTLLPRGCPKKILLDYFLRMLADVRSLPVELSTQPWVVLNRFCAYALLNLLDDPAILALGFC